jgi:hypothetical protein
MNLRWLICLTALMVGLLGCSNSGGGSNFTQEGPQASLLLPTGDALVAGTPGAQYTFEVYLLGGLRGDGVLTATLSNPTGSVSLASVFVNFSEFEPIAENNSTLVAVGTLSDAFVGSGTVTVDISYVEGLITLTGSFTVTVTGLPPVVFSFSPSSPLALVAGDPEVQIDASATPLGGTFVASNLSLGTTGGYLNIPNPFNGIFSFGGSTAAGTVTLTITYNRSDGGPDVSTVYTINVAPSP